MNDKEFLDTLSWCQDHGSSFEDVIDKIVVLDTILTDFSESAAGDDTSDIDDVEVR